MSSVLHTLHEAHKQRIARICANAYVAPRSTAPDLTPGRPMRERGSARREYEKPLRFVPNMMVGQRIKIAIAAEFGVTVADLTGPSRKSRHTLPRFFAIGLLFEMTSMSIPAIGRQFGDRDHCTIINARKRAAALFAQESIRNRVDQIKAEIAG